ncbi:MAG: hypothetical protein AAF557_18365 [Pseudomonadota bacterium]
MSRFLLICLAFAGACGFALVITKPWQSDFDLASIFEKPAQRLDEISKHTLYAATGCTPLNEQFQFCGGHDGWRGIILSTDAPFQIFESGGLILTVESFEVRGVPASDPRRMLVHKTAVEKSGGVILSSDRLPVGGLFNRKNTIVSKREPNRKADGIGIAGVFDDFSLAVGISPLNDDYVEDANMENLLKALKHIERR